MIGLTAAQIEEARAQIARGIAKARADLGADAIPAGAELVAAATMSVREARDDHR